MLWEEAKKAEDDGRLSPPLLAHSSDAAAYSHLFCLRPAPSWEPAGSEWDEEAAGVLARAKEVWGGEVESPSDGKRPRRRRSVLSGAGLPPATVSSLKDALRASPYAPKDGAPLPEPKLVRVAGPTRRRSTVEPTPPALPWMPTSYTPKDAMYEERRLYFKTRAEMEAFRDTLPLKFLAEHEVFREYVSLRTKAALRLMLAALWEARVGSALDKWKRMVRVARLREAMAEMRRARGGAILRSQIKSWMIRVRKADVRSAWAQWVWFAQWQYRLAAVAACHRIQPIVRGWLGRRIAAKVRAEARRRSLAHFRIVIWLSAAIMFRNFRRLRRAQSLIRRWWCWRLRWRWLLSRSRAGATAMSKTFRRHYVHTFFVDLRNAQIVISRAWRAVLAWRMQAVVQRAACLEADTQWWAAGEVQRVWRGHVARSAARAQRHRNEKLHLCAVRVQCGWYRRNNMFTAFVLLRSLVVQHDADVEEQLTSRVNLRTHAASNIQAMWRGRLARHRTRMLLARGGAVVRIQAWWRARQVQTHLASVWAAAVVCLTETRAARRIQGAWLKAVPGRLLASLRARKLRQLDEALAEQEAAANRAATAIQATYRRYVAEMKFEVMRATARTHHAAAVVVTAFVRDAAHYRLRQRLFAAHTTRWLAVGFAGVVHARDVTRHAAALLVQSAVRGMLGRRLVAHLRVCHAAAAVVQTTWSRYRLRCAALRAVDARKRARVSMFRRIKVPRKVVAAGLERATTLFDTSDADRNQHVRAVVKRLGLRPVVASKLLAAGVRGLSTLEDCDEGDFMAAGIVAAADREGLISLCDAREWGMRGGTHGTGNVPLLLPWLALGPKAAAEAVLGKDAARDALPPPETDPQRQAALHTAKGYALVDDLRSEYLALYPNFESRAVWAEAAWRSTPTVRDRDAAGDTPLPSDGTGPSCFALRTFLAANGSDIKTLKGGWDEFLAPPPRDHAHEIGLWDAKRAHAALRILFAAAERVLVVVGDMTLLAEPVMDAVATCIAGGIPGAVMDVTTAVRYLHRLQTALEAYGARLDAVIRCQAVARMRAAIRAARKRKLEVLHERYLVEQQAKLTMDARTRWEQVNAADNAAWEEYYAAVAAQEAEWENHWEVTTWKAAVVVQTAWRGYATRRRWPHERMVRLQDRVYLVSVAADVEPESLEAVSAVVVSRSKHVAHGNDLPVAQWLSRLGLRALVGRLRRRSSKLLRAAKEADRQAAVLAAVRAKETDPGSALDTSGDSDDDGLMAAIAEALASPVAGSKLVEEKATDAGGSPQQATPPPAAVPNTVDVLALPLAEFKAMGRRQWAAAGINDSMALNRITAAVADTTHASPAKESQLMWDLAATHKLFHSTFPTGVSAATKFAQSIVSLMYPPSITCLKRFFETLMRTGAHPEHVQAQAVPRLGDGGTLPHPSHVREVYHKLRDGATLLRFMLHASGLPSLGKLFTRLLEDADDLRNLPRAALGRIRWEKFAFDYSPGDDPDRDGRFAKPLVPVLKRTADAAKQAEEVDTGGMSSMVSSLSGPDSDSDTLSDTGSETDSETDSDSSSTGSSDGDQGGGSPRRRSSAGRRRSAVGGRRSSAGRRRRRRSSEGPDDSDGYDSRDAELRPPRRLRFRRRVYNHDGHRLRRLQDIDAWLTGGAGEEAAPGPVRAAGPRATRASAPVVRAGELRRGSALTPLLVATSSLPPKWHDDRRVNLLKRVAGTMVIAKQVGRRNTANAAATAAGGTPPAVDLRRCELEAARMLWDATMNVLRLGRSVTCLQQHVRGFLQRHRYKSLVVSRENAAFLIQRVWLGHKGRSVARDWRAVRWSHVEQCYDQEAAAFFYVDTYTGETSWEAPPDGIFRPSTWWQLPKALPPGKCCVCRVNDSDRYCNVCVFDDEADELEQDPYKGLGFPRSAPGARLRAKEFCFVCYATVHRYTRELRAHTFSLRVPPAEGPLMCVECGTLATRYCPKCDDCFCDADFDALHRKGNRATHAYEAFPANAPRCAHCEVRPAHRSCSTCDETFCEVCAKKTHAKGQRRHHAMALVDTLPVLVKPGLAAAGAGGLLSDNAGGKDADGTREVLTL